MWIRSQDKKSLIDVKAVTIETIETRNKIFGWMSNDYYFNMGQYNTEEDIIKVLDMIQNYLGCAFEKNVFQMPQKDEIK